MEKLERALRQIGLSEYDVQKHIKRGASLTDLESFIDSIEGNCLEWEDITGTSKEEFIARFESATKDEVDFIPDVDLVIVGGEKYLIEYVL